MLSHAHAADLAGRMHDVGFTLDRVSDRIGPSATAALGRNTTLAARDALGAADDPQATLIRLFLVHDALPAAQVRAALGELTPLVDAGVLAWASGSMDECRADVEVRPYAADGPDGGFDGWVCQDLVPSLDGRIDEIRPDWVLGVSPASTRLAQMAMRTPVGSALDLGTGCGVQALHLATHAEQIVATDLNPRALEVAQLTLRLNQVDADLRLGSLYEPVVGELFDLIVTNPPYVMSPPDKARLTYREGHLTGDDLVRRVVIDGARHLAPGGSLQVLGNWAVLAGEPWQDRLAGWVAQTGCDALIIERELLDPYEYIEIWLNDAGLLGSPEYAQRYRQWRDYFSELGITGVGMGWLTLHRAGRAVPDVQIESWPHAVYEPVGEAFAAHHAAVGFAERSDEELLATAWVLDPRVVQEAMGRPGDEDPEHLIFRQQFGFGRALEAGTLLGAVIGASDGELTAAQIVAAVASLLSVDADAAATEVVPQLRTLVRDGYLRPA